MKPRTIVAVLAALLILPTLPAWSQSAAPSTTGLTQAEQQSFDARLNAARSDADLARIMAERDNLIQTRLTQPGSRQIPASPREAIDDPIMADVPTPRADRVWSQGTLPGGALAPTGTGTGPSTTTGGWGWSE
jgi:hypothetical protein